jgi:hypothetical protein
MDRIGLSGLRNFGRLPEHHAKLEERSRDERVEIGPISYMFGLQFYGSRLQDHGSRVDRVPLGNDGVA